MPEETVSMLALRCSRRRTRASPAAPGAGALPSSLRRFKLQAPKSRGIRPNRPNQGESSVQNGVPGGEIQSGRCGNSAQLAFARLRRGKPRWVRVNQDEGCGAEFGLLKFGASLELGAWSLKFSRRGPLGILPTRWQRAGARLWPPASAAPSGRRRPHGNRRELCRARPRSPARR